jgi:hypothetical protein
MLLVKGGDDICIGTHIEPPFLIQFRCGKLATMSKASPGWNLGGMVLVSQAMRLSCFK